MEFIKYLPSGILVYGAKIVIAHSPVFRHQMTQGHANKCTAHGILTAAPRDSYALSLNSLLPYSSSRLSTNDAWLDGVIAETCGHIVSASTSNPWWDGKTAEVNEGQK